MANALGELFQDIADAIRDKTGNTGLMVPFDFPEQIASIEVGTGGPGGAIKWVAATGEFTPENTGDTVTVEHNMGVAPDFVFVMHITWIIENIKDNYPDVFVPFGFAYSSEIMEQLKAAGSSNMNNVFNVYSATANNFIFIGTDKPLEYNTDKKDVVIYNANARTFDVGGNYPLHGGKKYTWIAVGHKRGAYTYAEEVEF